LPLPGSRPETNALVVSYRLGVRIVCGTVLVSAIVCSIWVFFYPPKSMPAAQDLGAAALPVGEFQLQERSGRTVRNTDLSERVWIASFIFTRCPLSCPRISGVMKGLQERLAKTSVLLVSISVDPEHDSPSVLTDYANKFGASVDRWWFLTGSKPSTYELVQNRFKLALGETPASDRTSDTEAISHSDRLALVDHGRVIGFFESSDARSLDELAGSARWRALPAWVRDLPTVNASLNALCAVFLVAGWSAIRRRGALVADPSSPASRESRRPTSLLDLAAVRAHLSFMLSAFATSSIFLTSYLVYHFLAGSMPFRQAGAVRMVYFTILLSHTLLATFGVVPLVIATLLHAVRGEFAKHARIARITFPIWLYVSITGVVIYLLLYHLPVPASLSQPLL
jgi:protein SCO1